jgi:hypothetical protein
MSQQVAEPDAPKLRQLLARIQQLEDNARKLENSARQTKLAYLLLFILALLALPVVSIGLAQSDCVGSDTLCLFRAGEPAVASEVNHNFDLLKSWLEQKTGAAGTPEVRISSTQDVASEGDSGSLVIGATDGTNLGLDNDEIQARDGDTPGTLSLQNEGGDLLMGNTGSSITLRDDVNITLYDCRWSTCVDTGNAGTPNVCPVDRPVMAGVDVAILADQLPAGCRASSDQEDEMRIKCCKIGTTFNEPANATDASGETPVTFP